MKKVKLNYGLILGSVFYSVITFIIVGVIWFILSLFSFFSSSDDTSNCNLSVVKDIYFDQCERKVKRHIKDELYRIYDFRNVSSITFENDSFRIRTKDTIYILDKKGLENW